MATRTEVANAALALLKENPIEFVPSGVGSEAAFEGAGVFDEYDDVQFQVGSLYPLVRSELLNAYPWSWLMERARLLESPPTNTDGAIDYSLDALTAPGGGFSRRYAIPYTRVDSIRAIYSSPRSNNNTPVVRGWQVFGSFVYTEPSLDPPLYIDAQRDVAEEAWPQLFTNAMVDALAARLSLGLLFDLPTTRYLEQRAERSLTKAQRVDAQSQPPFALTSFDWLDARQGGDYGRLGSVR